MQVKNKLSYSSLLVLLSLNIASIDSALAASSLPLLTIDKVQYKGAFRIPSGTYGASSADYSYGAIGFNPDKNSLFVAGHEYEGAIAEFPIPAIVNSTDIGALKTASTPIQSFAKVLSKATNVDWGQGLRVSGIYYSGSKLMVNMYRFYDNGAPFMQTPTMILEDANGIAATKSLKGYLPVQGGVAAGGWVSPIPTEFQSALGGTHISGFTSSTARAIVYTGSNGPAAFAFSPNIAMANSATTTSISTVKLVAYSLDNPLAPGGDLYNTSRTNQYWTHASEASYGMIVPGTRSYLVLGVSGGHKSGIAYGDPPYGGYKGYYTIDQKDIYTYYWLYDVNDFEKAKNGTIQPYAIKPYAVGKFNAPFQGSGVNPISGGTFDAATGTMYLSISRADTQSGGNPSIIAAYKFDVAASTEPSPPKPPGNITGTPTN